jgi:hypothetical protein
LTRIALASAAALVSAAPAGLLVTTVAPAGTPRPPTVKIERATVDRTTHTVELRLRICFSAGPRAQIAISERRTYRANVSSRHWVPSGEKSTRISPFACRRGWRLNWLLQQPLQGPGTYTASVRVRDAYARWTPSVSFSVTSS